jgi:hypothetical protein
LDKEKIAKKELSEQMKSKLRQLTAVETTVEVLKG